MKPIIKPTLMIHEVSERIFDLPLENYTLTFDDGLYSQYYYWDRIQAIPTQKYFFISSNIVCKNEAQNPEYITCVAAHKKAKQGIYENYMTIQQIKELAKDPNVTIGGHGHSHKNLNEFDKVTEQIKFLVEDTRQMMAWFSFYFNSVPTTFCFPYNNDLNGMYKGLLSKLGFTQFYGQERTPVESLF